MSDNIAIRAEKIGKTFKIYSKPKDRLKELNPFRRRNYHTEYEALKEINFEINKGDFVGIVGKNGAGKSTLLRIISGEMTPTSGQIERNGSISLLQLGVGFDKELSGIENAKFASKLLGYSTKEINQLIDSIVDFAEIGDFINYPVKTYSTGMHSRLSFAVGVNISPDILVADEVLSVGDSRFSQKCLRKMHEIKDSGKTVILVTHSTTAVGVFCNKAMWIKDGGVFQFGDATTVSNDYNNYMISGKLPGEIELKSEVESNKVSNEIQNNSSNDSNILWDKIEHNSNSIGSGDCLITGLSMYSADLSKKINQVNGNEWVHFLVKIKSFKDFPELNIGWILYNQHGLPTLHMNNEFLEQNIGPLKAGEEAIIDFHFLLPSIKNGTYFFAPSISTPEVSGNFTMLNRIHEAYPIEVARTDSVSKQHGEVYIEKAEIINRNGLLR